MTPSQVLNAVADAYESGELWWVPFWATGARNHSHVLVDERCGCIIESIHRVGQRHALCLSAWERLYVTVKIKPQDWNDHHCQSTAHAIATLRAAAGKSL